MMTHQTRLKRRQLMAQALRDGETAMDVAEMFGVSIGTVYIAAREHGVAVTRRPTFKAASRRRIAETMLRCGTPQADIARRLGISRQRVHQIRKGMQ